MRWLLFSLVVTNLAMGAAQAAWRYSVVSPKGSPAHGTLDTVARSGETLVSVRQLCAKLGCRTIYNWGSHRAVISNPASKLSAIVSSITHMAIVDGAVVDFDGQVISDVGEGYLLPMNLAVKLASALKLGRIEPSQAARPAASASRATSLKTVVIDPGHGGNDWGTGFAGVYEKDMAFFYAIELRDQLKEAMPGLKVLLTRDSDKYVSLPDRARLANGAGADLFISIHVNHAPDSRIQGAETYILSPDATDNEARQLALLENESWMKTARISDSGDMVKKILVDMEQTKYIQHSALAASLIHQELTGLERGHGLRNRGVKQAMFYVLSQVAMPSVLVEIGFVSSAADRSRLMDVIFRDEFVKGIVTALKKYGEKF